MEQTVEQHQKSYRLAGLTGTLLFHGTLLVIMLLVVFATRIPPFLEGGGGPGLGIEVNLGSGDEGTGISEEEISMPRFTPPPKTSRTLVAPENKTEQTGDESILTQETDESPGVSIIPKKISSEAHPGPVVNPLALYKGKTKTSEQGVNEGITGNPGNQGNPGGAVYSKNYTGEGGPGSGGGQGGGIGKGTGTGIGDGVSYELTGRKSKYLEVPPPPKNLKEIVYVVVRITVSPKGEVTDAIAGTKGTTTTDQSLWRLAREAALHARFDAKPDAAIEQKGTIKYKFVPH